MSLNVQMILDRVREFEYIHSIKSFGEENPERVFYVIWRKQGAGFFSNIFHVLGHLQFADSLGMTPVVDMENCKTFYNEANPINGSSNAWEYYYRQPAGFSLAAINKSKNVVFCNGEFIDSIYYDLEICASIIRKYLFVHDHIQKFCDDFVAEFFTGKKVLGIHFRGQEMWREPGHPTPATPDQVIERTQMLLDRFSIDRIFIVSEEQAYVDLLKREFGDMVVCTNAFRTYDINAYYIRPYPRKDHMYNLGLDVLRDALILSKPDYFLTNGEVNLTGSNVSLYSLVLNGGAYQHVEYINNGNNT